MSKADRKSKTAKSSSKATTFTLPEMSGKGWFFTTNFRIQAVAVALIAVLFYGNSYKNEYALDDDIVMRQNTFVQKGFSGIWDIMANDAYKSFYASMGVNAQLEGGRYRPLSIVTFAIEQQLFGECYGERYEEVRDSVLALRNASIPDPPTLSRLVAEQNDLDGKIKATTMELATVRHIVNIMLYALLCVVLLWFLRECVFRTNTDLALLSVALFAIHPIHTEVVANVKSRDEIMSLLFIALTFIYFFRFDISRNRKDLTKGAVFFLLAYLSKEYAIALLALIPLGLHLFHKRSFSNMVPQGTAIVLVTILYAVIRLSATATEGPRVQKNKNAADPLNEPYMYAKGDQVVATKINRLDDYLVLLVKPYPLVSDYSYQHFPYVHIYHWQVLLSILIYALLVYVLWRWWKQQHPLAFALLIYFGFFALISNLLFDIGATMGERLIFHSSLGFCMVLAWGIVAGIERFKIATPVASIVFVLLCVPAFMITAQRNLEWKNDASLFISDVKKHPESALCNGNAGARFMDRGVEFLGKDSLKVYAYADTAIQYLTKATTLHPRYVNGWLNLGLAYYHKKDFDQSAAAWAKVSPIFPRNPILLNYTQMYINTANAYAQKQDYPNAARYLGYAARMNPQDKGAWADYAGASFMSRQFGTAKEAFIKAIELNPDAKDQLQGGLNAAASNELALNNWKADSADVTKTLILARNYTGTVAFYPESRRLINKVLQVNPNETYALKLQDSLSGLERKVSLPK
jgi:tetratricopeptide (TPR) repeat protein